MTTNSFAIANVKQMLSGGSFRILLPFSRTSRGVGVPNSAIFNGFHNRVEFGTILEGLRNFGELKPPSLGTPPTMCPFFIKTTKILIWGSRRSEVHVGPVK